jgi:hypothetical protein
VVRPSKRGELLVRRKLGLRPAADQLAAAANDQVIAAVLKGPIDHDCFEALRDIFPAARALSDADLLAVARLDSSAICAC